ncbi:hypothetical protein [Streptomyces pseudogriseolus]|uniref:hypothetical protein n=1 Tax=Streptomyces pseudogriseolus TaxID=36817 RepID=UPI003FA2BFDB
MFGLLAFNAIPDGPGVNSALEATVLVVLGSLLLHGGGSMAIDRLLRVKPRQRTVLVLGTEPAAETTRHHAPSCAGEAVVPGAAGGAEPAAGTADGDRATRRQAAARPASEGVALRSGQGGCCQLQKGWFTPTHTCTAQVTLMAPVMTEKRM